MKFLLGLIVIGGLLFAGYVALMLNWSYAEGERAGYVQKLSKKGWLCKTWEGEIALVSMPGAVAEKFAFTVPFVCGCRELGEALGAGSLVVLPGDAGYVVLASASTAGGGLTALSALAPEPPAVLASGPDEPTAFGLAAPLPVRRLMYRAWPAPLTIALEATGAHAPSNWTAEAWSCVRAGGLMRFRCPDHPPTESRPGADHPPTGLHFAPTGSPKTPTGLGRTRCRVRLRS